MPPSVVVGLVLSGLLCGVGCSTGDEVDSESLAGRQFWLSAEGRSVPEGTAVAVGDEVHDGGDGVELVFDLVVDDCVVALTAVVGDDGATSARAAGPVSCGPRAVAVVDLVSAVDRLDQARGGVLELHADGAVVAELVPIASSGRA